MMSAAMRNYFSKSNILKILHRLTCVWGMLLAAYGLLICVFTVLDALDDLRIYTDLGFSYSLHYFLRKEHFAGCVVFFLMVTGEIILYTLLCRRAEEKRLIPWGLWYLGTMLAIHAAAWVNYNSLQIPIPYLPDPDEVEWLYNIFINFTILPSIAYFTLYLMRVRKRRPKESLDN